MQISFFEEYPSSKSLSKLQMIPFSTKLYLAAKSLQEFLTLKAGIKRQYKNVDQVIYWPILDLTEGYWLSAFSTTSALKRVIKEMENTNEYILWDAELPLLNKKLFLLNLPFIFTNRQLIAGLIKNKEMCQRLIITAFPKTGFKKAISGFLYASFSHGNFSYIDMIYTSLLTVPNKKEYLKKTIEQAKNNFGEYKVALGLIGRGEEDKVTPLIGPNDLKKDLHITQREKVKEVVLYRLGGLNEEYLSVLKQFHD